VRAPFSFFALLFSPVADSGPLVLESDVVILQLDEDLERAQDQIFLLEAKAQQQQQSQKLETTEEREERQRNWERERDGQRTRNQERDSERARDDSRDDEKWLKSGERGYGREEDQEDLDAQEASTPTQGPDGDEPMTGTA